MNRKIAKTFLTAGAVSLLALGALATAEADQRGRHDRFEHSRRPAARQELHHNRREIQRDRAELRRDMREYHQDRTALQRAHRRGASPAEIGRLRGEVRESGREVAESRRELREDFAEHRRDLDRFGYGNSGWQGNRGRWDRNERGWWNWGNGRRDNSRWDDHRGRGFDYGRD
jgi:hypothetical protein